MAELPTNKYPNPAFHQEFGENAKVLEDLARKIDWRFLTVTYFKALAILCATVFSIIVSVKLALSLF